MRVRMETSMVRGGKAYVPGREYDLPDDLAQRLMRRDIVSRVEQPEEPKRAPRQTRKGLGGAPENKADTPPAEVGE